MARANSSRARLACWACVTSLSQVFRTATSVRHQQSKSDFTCRSSTGKSTIQTAGEPRHRAPKLLVHHEEGGVNSRTAENIVYRMISVAIRAASWTVTARSTASAHRRRVQPPSGKSFQFQLIDLYRENNVFTSVDLTEWDDLLSLKAYSLNVQTGLPTSKSASTARRVGYSLAHWRLLNRSTRARRKDENSWFDSNIFGYKLIYELNKNQCKHFNTTGYYTRKNN